MPRSASPPHPHGNHHHSSSHHAYQGTSLCLPPEISSEICCVLNQKQPTAVSYSQIKACLARVTLNTSTISDCPVRDCPVKPKGKADMLDHINQHLRHYVVVCVECKKGFLAMRNYTKHACVKNNTAPRRPQQARASAQYPHQFHQVPQVRQLLSPIATIASASTPQIQQQQPHEVQEPQQQQPVQQQPQQQQLPEQPQPQPQPQAQQQLGTFYPAAQTIHFVTEVPTAIEQQPQQPQQHQEQQDKWKSRLQFATPLEFELDFSFVPTSAEGSPTFYSDEDSFSSDLEDLFSGF